MTETCVKDLSSVAPTVIQAQIMLLKSLRRSVKQLMSILLRAMIITTYSNVVM